MTHPKNISAAFPVVRTVGFDGMLVSFDEKLSEPANRAALAFRAAVAREGWSEVTDVSSSLVSVCVRFDPLGGSHAEMQQKLTALLAGQDWYQADLPEGRRFWRVPTVYGTDLAPQLDEAAGVAGMTAEEAIKSLSAAKVRVQTIGFAPGQPYLGELPEAWDIPRQAQLTESVPEGALVVAIRQFVLFSVTTPTGWRHVGQTAIKLFQPDAEEPFILRPGDEVQFVQTDPASFANMRSDAFGGAVSEVIR